MERYKDYSKALLDGYVIANPKLKPPSITSSTTPIPREADLHFDPAATALLCAELRSRNTS